MSDDAMATNTGGNRFKTTRWTLILASSGGAGPGEEKARAALSQLCRTYWRPIFAFICHLGYSEADAQDLTQDFFVMIVTGNLLQKADKERGHFRSLLLCSLKNFLKDAREKRNSEKRGGAIRFVPWDDWMAESPSRLTLSMQNLAKWPPEQVFDVRWAATVAERALARLQEECEGSGRRRLFEATSHLLTAEREDVSYERIARELGLGVEDIRRLLHRLRQRYRQLLREEVADTVEKSEDVDAELHYLVAALAAGMKT